MSAARCDLTRVLLPEVWAQLSDPTRLNLLWLCGCSVFPDGDGWVARFRRSDRISAADRERVIEQTRNFLECSPSLWPLAAAER